MEKRAWKKVEVQKHKNETIIERKKNELDIFKELT